MSTLSDLKTKRFWRYFLVQSFAAVGVLSSLMQFVIIVFPHIEVFFQGVWTFAIISIMSFVWGLGAAWPRPIEMEYNLSNTKIKIIKGDILDQEKSHLVVGVCDTFDTETPNIISQGSLLGQTILNIFGGDINRFDQLLNDALKTKTPVSTIEKDGKKSKYGIGTVARIHHKSNLIFFLAYCEMDERNKACCTITSVWNSLSSLWEEQSNYGNHKPISIPVIGGGLARISGILPAQDSIRLIILSYMFASREEKISDELRIIVRPEDYNRLDRLELHSFLASLKSS